MERIDPYLSHAFSKPVGYVTQQDLKPSGGPKGEDPADDFEAFGPPMGALESVTPTPPEPPPIPKPLWLPLLIRLRSSRWKPRSPEIIVQSRLGDVVTAIASAAGVRHLQKDPDVASVESSRPVAMQDCFRSVPWVGAIAAQTSDFAEKGANCLIGVIDNGIDIFHKTFLDEQGKTRILAIWDQRTRNVADQSPKNIDASRFDQDYGVLHLENDINAYLGGKPLAHGLTRNPGFRDQGGHGTHVASIAAGSPFTCEDGREFPGGVAPKAGIVFIISDLDAETGSPNSLGYSVSHVDALAFLRSFVETDPERRPIAVNISQGMNAGAHDGTSLLESAFDAFSGGGRDAGFVIVKSAGNERGHSGHAESRVFQDGVTSIQWHSARRRRTNDYLEVWYESADDLRFRLERLPRNPTGKAEFSDWCDRGAPNFNGEINDYMVDLSLTRFHHDNGDGRLVLTVWPKGNPIEDRWRLHIEGRSVKSEGVVHAWTERDNSRSVTFETGDVNAQTLSIPGTSRTVITVGACEAEAPLRLGEFSSMGPTRDGRRKPDLVAPGVGIVAAHSNQEDTTKVVAKDGTSMAAPHVAGAIALLMSRQHALKKSQLNAAQIQAGLSREVTNFSGRWHEGFGYGRLDVERLLEAFE